MPAILRSSSQGAPEFFYLQDESMRRDGGLGGK